MIYLQLFWEFFKAGLFSVGGGLATLPFLYDISDRLGWFTHAQIADMLAISESTPGPIGVNMASLCDMFVLIGISVMTLIFASTSKKIGRLEGAVMVLVYAADVVFAIMR